MFGFCQFGRQSALSKWTRSFDLVERPFMADRNHDSVLGSAPPQDNGSGADSNIRQSCTQAVGDFFLMLMNVFR